MGSTVVFTVPLDPRDDVDVSSRGTRGEPAREFAQQLRSSLTSRAWRWGLLAVVASSACAGAVAAGVEPQWTGLAPMVAGVVALIVAAAAVGACVNVSAVDGVTARSSRASIALARIAASAVAALALTAGVIPSLAWVARADAMREAQVVPMLVAIAASAAVAGTLGVAVRAWRPWSRPVLAGAIAGAGLVLVPLLGFGAAMPLTASTDQVEYLKFVAINVEQEGITRPAYICEADAATERRTHPERIAWLLGASPVVVVAGAPLYEAKDLVRPRDGSVAALQAALRSARVAPGDVMGFCYQPTSLGVPNAVREARVSEQGAGPALALALEFAALGALALAALSRRLRS